MIGPQELVNGMAYLHGKGIVHADLTATSVLLSPDQVRVGVVLLRLCGAEPARPRGSSQSLHTLITLIECNKVLRVT